MTEANFFFTKDASVFWKYRNFFHEGQLNEEEGKILASLRRSEPQAILPLPLFHGGSEMYERPGSNNSMIPSMIYSYHSNTPILSVLMSRTSLNETKEMIQLLNSYKKEKPVQKLLGTHDFFVLTTHDALLPDETRLLSHVKNFAENDTLKYGYISVKELLSRKTTKSTYILSAEKAHLTPDTTSVIFLPHENRKPFLAANIMDYETVFSLDSNQISTGTYVLSFHYHYDESTYRALGTNLIVNSVNTKGSEWINNIPIRILSGFYDGFGIFEYRLELEKQNKYEFLLKGYVDHTYRVSHFLLRPEARTVMAIDHNKDTLFNNFPK